MERDINGGRHQDEREDRSTNKAGKPNVSGSRWLDESRQKRKEKKRYGSNTAARCSNIQILCDVSGAQAPNLTELRVCSAVLNTRDSYLCVSICCISFWCQKSAELHNVCHTNTSTPSNRHPRESSCDLYSAATCISRWRNTPLPLNYPQWACSAPPLR